MISTKYGILLRTSFYPSKLSYKYLFNSYINNFEYCTSTNYVLNKSVLDSYFLESAINKRRVSKT